MRDDDRDWELLVAAGSAIERKPSKSIIAPHIYVIRGNKNEKIDMEEATWPAYMAALCRITKDHRLPPILPSTCISWLRWPHTGTGTPAVNGQRQYLL